MNEDNTFSWSSQIWKIIWFGPIEPILSQFAKKHPADAYFAILRPFWGCLEKSFQIGKIFQRSQNIKDSPLVTVMVFRIFFMTNKNFYFVQISKKKMPFGETLFFQDGHLINTQCAEKIFSKDLLFLEIWIFPILLVTVMDPPPYCKKK